MTNIAAVESRVAGVGPQIGFLFPVGDLQGYLNLKAYKEFAAAHRPEGWNTWLTLVISPAAAPPPPVKKAMITITEPRLPRTSRTGDA
jgi:hypothetical protein